MLMENVQSFLNAAKKYGVADEEVFQTPDLFEARNLPQVALCIFSLGNTTLYTRAANDPSVFIITEKAPTILLRHFMLNRCLPMVSRCEIGTGWLE